MAVLINGGSTSYWNGGGGGGSSVTSKQAVRAATQGNLAATRTGNVLTFNAPGALTKTTFDPGWVAGPALAIGDRILVHNQVVQADNGIYTVTDLGSGGSPGVLTRSTDANTSENVVPQMLVPTSEGTDANVFYYLSLYNPITLNTTALTFGVLTASGLGAAGGDLSGSYPNPQVVALTIPGQAQGAILYFNGVSWVVLPPGTSGDFLQTQGAGANPVWADAGSTPLTGTGTTVGGATITLVSVPVAAGKTIKIHAELVGRATAAPYDSVGMESLSAFREDGSPLISAVGSVSVQFSRRDTAVATADTTVTPAAGAALVRVTGAFGKTINWEAIVNVVYV